MRLMKYIPNGISSKIGRQLLVLSKHSPHILFGAGVFGFGVTTVLVARATLKLDDVLDRAKDRLDTADKLHEQGHLDYSDRDYKQDKAVICTRAAGSIVKLYAPGVLVGIASIGALTGSHVVLTRRNLGLTAAYAALEEGINQYRSRVIEQYGEEKDRELRYGLVDKKIIEETDKGHKTKTIKVPGSKTGLGSPYARFFDECSTSWNREDSYNQVFVKVQERWANDLLNWKGYVFLNDVYKLLGLEETPEGQLVGWLKQPKDGSKPKIHGDGYIDFGVFNNDNMWNAMRFVNGEERSVLLDFNVDGVIWNLI